MQPGAGLICRRPDMRKIEGEGVLLYENRRHWFTRADR